MGRRNLVILAAVVAVGAAIWLWQSGKVSTPGAAPVDTKGQTPVDTPQGVPKGR